LLFLSAINPNACRATGRGLQPKGVRVKEVADFKVFTKGAGSGSLSVSVKGPSESDSFLLFASLVLIHLYDYSLCLGFYLKGNILIYDKLKA